MTRFRISTIVTFIVVLVIAAIWGIAFFDINSRFPNAQQYYFTKTEPAVLDGIEITPLEKNIYKFEDFINLFPDCKKYSNLPDETISRYRIIVFNVKFRNTTQESLKFNAVSFIVESWPSAYNNGVTPVDGGKTRTIEPGEEQVISLVTNINDMGLIKTKYLNDLDKSKFYLVCSYYPEKKILKFE